MSLLATKSSMFPSLEIIGKKGWTPAGETSNLTFSSKESFYEIGIGLKWVFLSRSFYERVNQRKYQLEENKIDFEISKQQLKNQMAQLEKRNCHQL